MSMVNTCSSLLKELEELWKEMGETREDKDRILLELERECLQVYRRKYEEVSRLRAQLHHELATKEAELAALVASLGEHNLQSQMEKRSQSLKKQLTLVSPLLEDLRIKKEERMKQFANVLSEMMKVSAEIEEQNNHNDNFRLDGHDLSLRKLNEFQEQLQAIQKEKSDRLRKVLEYVNEVHSLCDVLELDFGRIVNEVHPSLQEKGTGKSASISDSTLDGLAQVVLKLKTEKEVRMQKLQGAIESLLKLWNLMETSEQERLPFKRLKGILGSQDDTILSGLLSLKIIEQAEDEVERLTRLKESRMKEIATRRRSELEEICREAHIQADTSTSLEKCYALIDSGLVNPVELVANFEAQIVKAKEEAISRKEIMDKINRWLVACDEENWLEAYNQDGNRYGGRGAHLNRKRAEKSRVIVNKIPDMVDNLIAKTFAWEDEHDIDFLYDGVRLVSILEEYKHARFETYEEKRQLRDNGKLPKESVFESQPSPQRSYNFNRTRAQKNGNNGNDKGYMNSPSRQNFGDRTKEQLELHSYSSPKKNYFKNMIGLSTTKLSLVTRSKESLSSNSELGFQFRNKLWS